MNTLRLYPDKILKQKSILIEKIDDNIKNLIEGMKKKLLGYNAAGLAAVQLGYPIQIICVQIDFEPTIFINPKIISFKNENKIKFQETCLSIPGVNCKINRANFIEIEAFDENMSKQNIISFQDNLAIVLQHEIDHLEGILLFDRMGSAQKSYKINSYKKRMKSWMKVTKQTWKI